ncbi:MAG: efflux RND transporter permease subunit [Hahellaceae bacterium]|nr:efflux RND transporter permease subunit [Hahellaceae bacterium]
MTSYGLSGRIAQFFQNHQITPLLALVGLLLGLFAIAVTPKEEEPQIDVTFANIFIPYPGASATEVEHVISTPAEQVLSEIEGVKHVYSTSASNLAVLSVQFDVGVPRQEALVKLYNQIYSHADWLPAGLGVGQPLIKPKGIDDVPVMSITLWPKTTATGVSELRRLAHSLETELKRIQGTRDIYTIGAPEAVVEVELDTALLSAYQISYPQLKASLMAGNINLPSGQLTRDSQIIPVQAGSYFQTLDELRELIITVNAGQPVTLDQVARLHYGSSAPTETAWFGQPENQTLVPAVTLNIAKQPGINAVELTQQIEQRLRQLQNIVIPESVGTTITRNYGASAAEKSDKLIHKLLFATAAVILLVMATLGLREAVIVGSAILVTLALTLFASWAWGFTLNRVSLFALIFSIGILVDDAIVVVENIHRHMSLGESNLLKAIPAAVDEVGGATILATLTVIAALMPMAFVSGLMGPYMSPIPINASTGMLISLVVAFVVTPWLAFKLLHAPSKHHATSTSGVNIAGKMVALFLDATQGYQRRLQLVLAMLLLVGIALAMPFAKWVVMKMLPFDNKSEIQVVVDLPEGTPVENTLAVLQKLADEIAHVPEVADYQLYAGTHAPINFNGLVRQYYLRQSPHMGDIQINLVDKAHRMRKSHDIAKGLREPLQRVGEAFNATIQVVEVPPGPPVMAPLVAEIYGFDTEQRQQIQTQVHHEFKTTEAIVDVDTSAESPLMEQHYRIDRAKAALLGLSYEQIINTVNSLYRGDEVSYLHTPDTKYAIPIRLRLGNEDKSNPHQIRNIQLANNRGELIPLTEVLMADTRPKEPARYHKDLLPVAFVTGDMAGELDSPLYGMAEISAKLPELTQWFIHTPDVVNRPALKWAGEWQITYETFRDMGIAYAIGMVLIYLLVVAQFHSYLTPLVIMAPIPLTLIGVMPGHALLGAQFTATSMIGMIALAGIIVRNSILLVDFINENVRQGVSLEQAVIQSASVRAKPILLTAFAAVIGALFILDDPIFSGLAISLIFGILVSSLLTLVVIPVLYFTIKRNSRTVKKNRA